MLAESEATMQVEEAIAELQRHGFNVGVRSWSMGDPTLEVATFADEQYHHGEDLIRTIKDIAWIYFRDGHWGFHKVTSIGGIGPHDIDYPTDSLDEAVSVLLTYYFREPITVGNWIVPIHMHPEWDRTRIQVAIDQAETISPDRWDVIQREHRELYSQRARSKQFSDVFKYLFETIFHTRRTDIQLHLRRDLQSAFVVPSAASHSRI
jgi:hypothetical protein